jgi:hypothetical protein
MGRSKRGAQHDSAASAAQRRLQVCMPACLAEARPPCSLGHITGVPCDYMVVLQEAETMQQRGERRKGEEAMAHLSRAVDAYRDAMGMNLTESDQTNAIVLCAECLQQMAAQAQAAAASRSDASQSAEGEATACKLARQTLQQAVQAGDHSALHFSRWYCISAGGAAAVLNAAPLANVPARLSIQAHELQCIRTSPVCNHTSKSH